jgi:hypothetical protein
MQNASLPFLIILLYFLIFLYGIYLLVKDKRRGKFVRNYILISISNLLLALFGGLITVYVIIEPLFKLPHSLQYILLNITILLWYPYLFSYLLNKKFNKDSTAEKYVMTNAYFFFFPFLLIIYSLSLLFQFIIQNSR